MNIVINKQYYTSENVPMYQPVS